jgi:hypothetical protein
VLAIAQPTFPTIWILPEIAEVFMLSRLPVLLVPTCKLRLFVIGGDNAKRIPNAIKIIAFVFSVDLM